MLECFGQFVVLVLVKGIKSKLECGGDDCEG